MLYTIVKILVLPPTSFFVLFIVAALLKKRWPRLGRVLLSILLLVVYLATTPFLAGELMAPLQRFAPVDLQNPDPEVGAILVLGAGVYFSAPEYWEPGASEFGVDAADSLTLQRTAYAAYLARATGKPVMVSGGPVGMPGARTVAEVMQRTLQRDFGVPVRWVEDRSDNTATNAVLSAAKLRDEGIDKVYLVTHAWHMPRAIIAFEQTGIEVVPAPTRFVSRSEVFLQDFIPSAKALLATYYAIHEWLGIAWYRLRA
ncbi:MAG: YdcF family protein [Kiloniellaceae bacterium]